jgi:uncharacterized protein (DUF433 family)
VAHSGLEVWEIVAAWKEGGESWDVLREAYPELGDLPLRSALAYYRLYPDEIDLRLAREAGWTAERLAVELPFTRPPAASSTGGAEGSGAGGRAR